ncbi:M55 family metallopeptidase [Desulfofustis limnaeus]|jgi:D-amino peptidase|uniref:Peptide ABC transporter n=1 Tax=Desulfofustis limnaeus TaxID=2740163 RepID=A0ABM7W574_9BACT|nr:M55 family metallopeptidase [Desulfofustis limnaeus]MDX9897234.1 M55 family metallopeptidase [Desulfofustis sp.]BDD86026.1 peptide ABC transporter [Desulfofustis limnaeus]
MKVYISADIEGIGCVVRSEHSSPGGREYERARRFMTAEVNSAALGAFAAGATDVVVADSHNVGLNLIPEELDERVRLIMGSPRPLAMMEGIDSGFDAVFLVGYHGCAGTADAVIAHTFTGRMAEVRFNDLVIGEIGISALLAGAHRVPVVFMSGDDAGCREAEALLPGLATVAVKQGIGAYAALCSHPRICRQRIQKTAEAALRACSQSGFPAPLTLSGPITVEMRFTTASGVDRVLRMPRVERLDGNRIRYQAADVHEAFAAFNTMADLIELTTFI